MASERVIEAVNYLIEAPNYGSLVNEMTRIIETWDTHPMVYGGKLTCLNALIDIGLQDREAFERVLKLVQDKRGLVPKIRRKDYQRELMRERRARLGKAVELHELLNGPLRGAARMQQMQDTQERWAKARDAFLETKGKLGYDARNAAIQEFWQTIDTNLDKNLADARKKRKVAC